MNEFIDALMADGCPLEVAQAYTMAHDASVMALVSNVSRQAVMAGMEV